MAQQNPGHRLGGRAYAELRSELSLLGLECVQAQELSGILMAQGVTAVPSTSTWADVAEAEQLTPIQQVGREQSPTGRRRVEWWPCPTRSGSPIWPECGVAP